MRELNRLCAPHTQVDFVMRAATFGVSADGAVIVGVDEKMTVVETMLLQEIEQEL